MRLLIRRASGLDTAIISSKSRATRFVRLRRLWLLPPLVRRTLPVPVIWNRRAVALCVLILGMIPLVKVGLYHKQLPNEHRVADAQDAVVVRGRMAPRSNWSATVARNRVTPKASAR